MGYRHSRGGSTRVFIVTLPIGKYVQHCLSNTANSKFRQIGVYETRTATPARTSSDTLQRNYCFSTLPLKYHPKSQNEASYNLKIPENHLLFFEDKHSKSEFYFGGLGLQYRTPAIGLPSCEIENDNFRDSQRRQIRTENKRSFESKVLKQK